MLELSPVKFEEAIAAAAARKVVLPDEFYGELWGRERALAFSVAGMARVAHVRHVLRSLVRAMETGRTFKEWKGDALRKPGLRAFPQHRLETIFRTNLQGHYAAGRCVHIKRHADTRPFLLYSAINDGRVRPSHWEMNKTLLPVDHEFWKIHTPPNGFSCFPAGTEVATPDGWRTIETLRAGDTVLDGAARSQPVAIAFSRHVEEPLYRIEVPGAFVRTTHNHRLLTLRGWVRAENVQRGDVLVQRKEIAGLGRAVHDVHQRHAQGGDGEVPGQIHPLHRLDHLDAEIELRQIHIKPPASDTVVMPALQQRVAKMIDDALLGTRRWRVRRGMMMRKRRIADPLGCAHPGAHFRSARRRGLAQLGRLRNLLLAGVLGAAQPRRWSAAHRLAQLRAGLGAPLGIVEPLTFDRVAVVAGFDTEVLHATHERAGVDTPSVTQLPIGQSILDVLHPEGFASGAPLDAFDSLEDFVAWARAHAELLPVLNVRTALYNGTVHNLELGTGSYITRTGVVHNCRCSIISLTERQARRRGGKTRVPGAKAAAPDKGWDYSPCEPQDALRPAVRRTEPLPFSNRRNVLKGELGKAAKDATSDAYARTNPFPKDGMVKGTATLAAVLRGLAK